MAVTQELANFETFSVTVFAAGLQAVHTAQIAENSVARVEYVVIARQADGSERAIYKRTALVFRQGSGPVKIQKTWLADQTVRSNSAFNLNYELSQTAITLLVKNPSAQPVQWFGRVSIDAV